MMDDEAVALLRTHHAYFVPTLYTSEAISGDANVPESEKARSKQITVQKDRSFQLVLKSGLPIGFATDAAVVPHGQNAREFGYRVRLGQSPMDAIASRREPPLKSSAGATGSGRSRLASSPTSSPCRAIRCAISPSSSGCGG